MSELALVVGTLVLAFASAFFPFVSIELALVVAAATAPSDSVLVAQVVAAAAGQMLGKSCFFLGGRTASHRWTRKTSRPRHVPGRLRRVAACAARRRSLAAGTVFVSALTGLPPFAVVSALAGAWRLQLASFFLIGFGGRLGRFCGVLAVPSLPSW